jgi:GTP-binding protein EngB required for normal cell division
MGLNENQQRRLRVTCEYIDRLLTEVEGAFDAGVSKAAFPRYGGELSQQERGKIDEYFTRLRGGLKDLLRRHGIQTQTGSIPARRALKVALTYTEIAIEDLEPRRMKGYGEMEAAAADDLSRFSAEMRVLLSEMNRYVKEIEGVSATEREGTSGAPRSREEGAKSGEQALVGLADVARKYGAGEIEKTARAIAERVGEGRFYVACVGQFKRGKSTLLNALVGRRVLPAGVVPVTAVPTVLKYGTAEGARVRREGEGWKEIEVKDVEEYVSEERNAGNWKGISSVEISLPSRLLDAGMCLVDTPGLGSVHEKNSATTESFLPHMDVALVVLGADPPLAGEELKLVERAAEEVKDLVFVLNKADRTSQKDRVEAREFARESLQRRLGKDVGKIYEVSALDEIEGRGGWGDWRELVGTLEDLGRNGRDQRMKCVARRGIDRAARQMMVVLGEERAALERPVEESERRMSELGKALEKADQALADLGWLLSAEQQKLSLELGERRKEFLREWRERTRDELAGQMSELEGGWNGVIYRRQVMHLAQAVARKSLEPWLQQEARYAAARVGRITDRFRELGNEYLQKLRESGVGGLAHLLEDLDLDGKLGGKSEFHFHVMERIAAPASPIVNAADVMFGWSPRRGVIQKDAEEFVEQLLEVNSARVQSDVEERVGKSRRELEAEIRKNLRGASEMAERALKHARAAQEAGREVVAHVLGDLERAEEQVRAWRRELASEAQSEASAEQAGAPQEEGRQ